MSRYFVGLPKQQIRNSLIDFSPVNQGLESISKAKQQHTQNALAERKMNMAEDQFAYQRGRDQKADAKSDVEWYGKQASAVDQMQGPQREAAWQRIISKHGAEGLTPEEMDPMTGPKLMMAQAGQFVDPLERKMKEAELAKTHALTAAAYQKAEPDPIKQFITDKLRRMQPHGGAPQGQPQAAPGGVQRQSFEGANGIPGLQLAADGTEAAPLPQPSQDMVDTPFGRMGRSEARDLGSTLLLDPRYATAGKAILDAVDGPNQGAMGRAAQNQIEERSLNASAQLGRLENIKTMFNPKFLEIPKRMEMMGLSWTSKMGVKLSAAQRDELSKYAAMRATIVNNLSTILKEVSGTAVTPQEYERIKNDQPNAGTGIFDGDDPVTLEAKLNNSIRLQRQAIARYNFMRSKGLNFDRNSLDQFLSLDDVPAAIDQRGAEIEGRLRKSGADPNTIDQQVRRQLKQEFGI